MARQSYVAVRERAVSHISFHPDSLRRDLSPQRRKLRGWLQVRDNHLYLVLVDVGGSGGDFVAAMVAVGCVVAATSHLQCDNSNATQATWERLV